MTVFRLAPSPAAERATLRAINDFQSDTAEILAARQPLRTRILLHTVGAMVLAALSLSAMVPVERVVTARGRVMADAPTIVVQPLETSIIRKLNVRAGEIVHKGDVLVALDPTFSTADVSTLKAKVAALGAEIARLKAELAEKPYVPDASTPESDLQLHVYRSHRAEYASQLLSYDQKIASSQSVIDRANRELTYYGQRLNYIRQVETMRTTLERNKVGSHLNTINASDARVEIERNVAVQEGIISGATHDRQSVEAERETFVQKWLSDLAQPLVQKQADLGEALDQLAKANKRHDLVALRAVEDAVVLQVGDVSVGSVVQSGQKIFTMVPLSGGLKAEVQLNASDQGFVSVGQDVDLKLDAWPYNQHSTVKGVIRSISGDSFSLRGNEGDASPAIYMTDVTITDDKLRDVPADFRLVPGMPLTADVKVGSHTFLNYLLEHALPTLTEGFREP